tara:strand:- start:126 stop:1040 length:915 start_codon:yes stop_codon:yes gene_type:complete
MLVICFDKNVLLGGLGDRVVGLISIKLISKLLRRPFYILWNKEDIKEYIDYSEYDYELLEPSNGSIRLYSYIDNQKGLKDYLLKSNNLFPDDINLVHTNQEIAQYLYKNKTYSDNDYLDDILSEYKGLYTNILKPTPFLSNKIKALIKNKDNIVGIQIRCGDCHMDTNKGESHKIRFNDKIPNILNKIKTKCDSLIDDYYVFLTTDSIGVVNHLKLIFDESRIIYDDTTIQHLDRKSIDDDNSKIFSDNIILSQKTRLLFISKHSNYGRIAALSANHDNIYDFTNCKIISKNTLFSKRERLDFS